jgi:beta-glucosidase-like glycosyl hydrolase
MGLPSLPFDARRLDSVELVPFRAGIAAGARAVMTAHLALPRIDSTGRPATLSRPVLTGILRERLGFEGIVVTDGMRMQGITDHFSSAEAAVLVIEAGGDAVLAPEDVDSAYNGLIRAVRTGRLSEKRINTSVRRMLAAKAWVGLAEKRTVDVDSVFRVVGSREFQHMAEEISDASITMLRNNGQVIPLPPSTRLHIIVVTDDPNPQVGTDLLEEIRTSVDSATLTRVSNETGSERFARIAASFPENDVVLVGIYSTILAWRGERRYATPLQDFLNSLNRCPKPVITVSFGDPYLLGRIPQTQVVLTPFNGTILAERSVAKAIAGKISIVGKMPVTVPGRYGRGDGMVLEMVNNRPR